MGTVLMEFYWYYRMKHLLQPPDINLPKRVQPSAVVIAEAFQGFEVFFYSINLLNLLHSLTSEFSIFIVFLCKPFK